MITTSITVNKNYRTSNDDQYARTTLIHNIELEEGETKSDATLRAIKEMDEIFTIAYPHVAPHLNFHIVRQYNTAPISDLNEIERLTGQRFTNSNGNRPIDSKIPLADATNKWLQEISEPTTEKTNNTTIEEKPVYKYPTATAETVKKEMENYKLSSKIFTAVYGEQVKGNAELEKVYADKLQQLKYLEEKPKPKNSNSIKQ
jgi:hypothetical protein